ncbi:MAG: sulfur carrier protein ThiS [Lachnospiraceae bacterium]|nr:sulfur carrier protein ThiS [Lachnospiraceae bacterium]
MVKINGNPEDVAGMTLLAYLQREGYTLDRLAVECNEQIVPKNDYGNQLLADGDVLEIVSFVGGG